MKGKNGMRHEAAGGTLDAVWPTGGQDFQRLEKRRGFFSQHGNSCALSILISAPLVPHCPQETLLARDLLCPGTTAFLCARVPATGGLSPRTLPDDAAGNVNHW